ncbi:MAG: alpha/beta hydrolase [Myxococcota bacterium]|nr:alpha/beta hydrolase [Myxococcota bacterium]
MTQSDYAGLPEGVSQRRILLPESRIEIALQDWGGDGPLALLHHANGFCAALWVPVAECLRDRFHVVAMDARGHGDSPMPPEGAAAEAFGWSLMADDLRQVAEILLAEVGQSQVALGLAHSFGGTLTLAAESRRPGLFEKLVLVDPVVPPQSWLLQARSGNESEMVQRARRRRDRWPSREEAREQLAGKALFADWTPRAFEIYVQEALRESPDGGVELKCAREVEAAVFSNSFSLDLDKIFPAVAAEARLLWAARGNFPLQIFQDVCSQLPRGELVELDAGHLIPMEKPEWVVEHVLDLCS